MSEAHVSNYANIRQCSDFKHPGLSKADSTRSSFMEADTRSGGADHPIGKLRMAR